MSSFPSLYSKVLKSSTAIALTAFFALPSHAMDDDPFNRPNLAYKFVPYDLKSSANVAEDVPNGKATVISNDDIIGSYLIESQKYPVKPNQALLINYDITVDGDIAFGFLNETRNYWYPLLDSNAPLVTLGSGRHKNQATMIVPQDATQTSLVFVHNKYHLGVSSNFEINNLKINGAEDPIFSSIYAKKAEFGMKKFVMTNNDIVGSYQIETTPFAVKGGQKLTATFELGLQGKLAFGCLSQERTNWYQGLATVEGDDVCETQKYLIDVTVPYGEKQASIVFVHNQPQQGVGSVFTLSDLKIGLGEQFNILENVVLETQGLLNGHVPAIETVVPAPAIETQPPAVLQGGMPRGGANIPPAPPQPPAKKEKGQKKVETAQPAVKPEPKKAEPKQNGKPTDAAAQTVDFQEAIAKQRAMRGMQAEPSAQFNKPPVHVPQIQILTKAEEIAKLNGSIQANTVEITKLKLEADAIKIVGYQPTLASRKANLVSKITELEKQNAAWGERLDVLVNGPKPKEEKLNFQDATAGMQARADEQARKAALLAASQNNPDNNGADDSEWND